MPVVDRFASMIMGSRKDTTVFSYRLSFSDEDDPVGINTQADRSIGEGCRHAVAIAFQMDETGRGNPLGMFDESVERSGRRHQMPNLVGPNVGDGAGLRSVRH